MRKNYVLYSALALGMMGSFASCSSDDDFTMSGVDNGGIVADADQVIEIAVENAGNGLETRNGRPLNSSVADQTINRLKLIIVDDEGSVVADTLYQDWLNASETYTENGHGRRVRFPLMGCNKLAKGGTYTAYAIGYHHDTRYQANGEGLDAYLTSVGNGFTNADGDLNKPNNSVEKVDDFSADLVITNPSANNNADEIFAGSAAIKMDANGKFTQGVTLHRQVAGVFSYLMNVPYMATIENGIATDKADHLQLVAVKKNQTATLGQFYGYALTDNGGNSGNPNYTPNNKLQNVVNGGSTVNAETVVYDIDLKKWFTEIVDEGGEGGTGADGIIDRYGFTKGADGLLHENKADKNWLSPKTNQAERFAGCTFVTGSVYGGEFIIPFKSAGTDKYTFKLRLVSLEAGGSVKKNYREWSVSLPDYDVLKTGTELTWWNGTSWTVNEKLASDESQSTYSVLRNHLYGVGTRTSNDPGNGTDPDDPTPDVDEPEDLTTKQDLLLQVNDNWELIHKMVIE